LGKFEKYLSIWVLLSIIIGTMGGNIFPNIFVEISKFEYASVNFLIAFFIWIMIFPMMVNVDFSSVKRITRQPKGLVLTLIVNCLIKPFSLAGLGIIFFEIIFSNFVTDIEASQYIAGMILLGVAPCTAMVFVWSNLTDGDPNYTLLQVSINDLIMIFAFAPLAALLLGITKIYVPWGTLILSIFLYVIIPLVMGYITRQLIFNNKLNKINIFNARMRPLTIIGLLFTIIILFGFQGEIIIAKPLIIVLISIPLLIQTYGIFFITYLASYILKLPNKIAAPVCLIGTSNFFELAVAVAIGIFGINSGAALATVVGVLVEVPVMLSLVYFINLNKKSFNF
jgi:ACR3 family arsenite transporter